jgi:DNA modification methylase
MTSIIPTLARRIEVWLIDRLKPYARNARTHSDEQVAQIAASIAEFGFNAPILVDSNAGIVAGHGRLLAARKLGLSEVPVVVLDHLSENQRRAYVIADNKLALNAGWDEKILAAELRDLENEGIDLALVGFSDDELEDLLAGDEPQDTSDVEEQVPEPPANPVSRPGDLWTIGPHRLVCGDCRDRNNLGILFPADARANVVITSPPYATQREYDTASGFKPIPPDEYVAWFADVAAGIASALADDGSYFLNIKEHADEGERNLYVKDLVVAHRRQWAWRFVDEFCWRKTDNGVPGGWNNRFKNAWEPVFHFCRQQQIKFRPKRVGHESDDCFDYSPGNPKSTSGSGLLGTGPRGAAADGGKNQNAWQRSRNSLSDSDGRFAGVARPSNVIEVKSESSQGNHSAPFPRALVEFFLLAFSDDGDVVYDPFMGSGTTIAAAALLDRVGYGCELSPSYCDVILHRAWNLTGETPLLIDAADGSAATMQSVAAARGVPIEDAINPKARDGRAIKHHGPNPHYGPRRKKAS